MPDWEDLKCLFQIISFILRITNEQDSPSLYPASAHQPSSMDCNNGRSIPIFPTNSFNTFNYCRRAPK